MIISGNLEFASISFQVDLRYLSILCCTCFTKLLQVTSRVSLGRRFEEESSLETLTYSKSLSFALHFSEIIPYTFQLISQLQKGHKTYFIYLLCWLEIFCACTEIFHNFSWCFAAFSASFSLLILQGSVIYWRYMLHITLGRLLSLPFLSLGNISPFLSCSSIIF